jgi:quinolinate synthase
MKMTTPRRLLDCLRQGSGEVHVDPDTAVRARRAVEAMIAIGEPGRGE